MCIRDRKEARGNLQDRLCNDNLTLDAFLTAQDMTREQLDQALLMQVRSQLTRQLALNAFADHCGLNVFDEDLEAFFEAVAPGKANAAHQEDVYKRQVVRTAPPRVAFPCACIIASLASCITAPWKNWRRRLPKSRRWSCSR